ncbi:hypothetical protein BaRGS_00033115 [Batillaria attramentaria]|uniref:CUB domain-containing protein n=1 Tax=Batillaria attramentaria TaxID=370345 RepID=A0ABD0JMB5_9CAEN
MAFAYLAPGFPTTADHNPGQQQLKKGSLDRVKEQHRPHTPPQHRAAFARLCTDQQQCGLIQLSLASCSGYVFSLSCYDHPCVHHASASSGIHVTPSSSICVPCQNTIPAVVLGFIQTPGWDGKSRIDFLMDSCVQITAPPGGRIIVSFVGFYYEVALGIGSCKYNSVRLFTTPNCTGHTIWKSCNPSTEYMNHPKIADSGVLSVNCRISDVSHISKDSLYRRSHVVGFKLRFSIHSAGSMLPVQVSRRRYGHLWNCTVPNWADFQQHFPCNLHDNCLNGEDEADCPYITDFCGKRRFQWGHQCYTILTWNASIPERRRESMGAASDRCTRHGGQLASLSSFGELEGVLELMNLLDGYRVYPDTTIGLSLTGHLKPDL